MPPRAADFQAVDFWVFDLDNTLYPASSGLFAQIDERMRAFVRTRFGVGDEEARAIQKGYYRRYGTTLNGLMSEHGVDPHEFLGFVHDIDVSELAPNPKLAERITALPGRKVVFTNGSNAHAERVARQLGLAHCFDGVMDIFALGFKPKPQAEAYDKLFGHFAADPKRAVLFEDIARNLKPAADLGFTTVLVHSAKDWSHEPPETRPAGAGEFANPGKWDQRRSSRRCSG